MFTPKMSRAIGWPLLLCFIAILGCTPQALRGQAGTPGNNGDAESEMARYTRIVQSQPDSAEARRARLQIGRIYAEQGDAEKAVQTFEKVVDDAPTSPEAGEALWWLAEQDADGGHYESARKRYLQFLLDFPQDDRVNLARLRMADCLFHLGKYTDALQVYADYAARYPKDSRTPAALLNMGRIYDEFLSAPEQATPIYRRIVTEFPNATEEIEVAQGRLKALGGVVPSTPAEPDEAEALRQVGPKTRPDARAELARWGGSPTFGYNPRQLLMESGMLNGEEMQESLAGDGALLDDAVYNMGLMFYLSEDYQRAGACLERAEALGIHESNLFLKLGVCYKRAGATDKAKQTFRQLVAIDSAAFEALIAAGEEELARGNYQEAIESLEVLHGVSDRYDPRITQALQAADQKIK